MDRVRGSQDKEGLPPDFSAECKEITADIRDCNEAIRYDKIVAARLRVASGYYNSGHVSKVIASRLLGEERVA